MENILWIIFIAFIVIGGGCMILNQIRQESAEKKIEKFEGSYKAIATKLGLSFESFTRSGDPTPGTDTDTVISFEGETVNAELTPAQALYFLESARKGSPDIQFLEGKSKWKSSPLP